MDAIPFITLASFSANAPIFLYFTPRSNMETEAPKKLKGGYRQINKALNICAFEDYLDVQQSRLPEIPDVEQISPRVLRVLGQNAGKVPTRTTLTPYTYSQSPTQPAS